MFGSGLSGLGEGKMIVRNCMAKVQNKLFFFRFSVSVFICLFLLISAPTNIYSQDSPIKATINHKHYTTDDLVILSVTVINDGSPQQLQPILPPLKGLAVINFDIVTNVREISGRIQTESVYTYQLQPRRTGSITIPPIAVEVDGEIYQTQAFLLRVSQGTVPAPSAGNAVPPENIVPPANFEGQDFFVEAVVDESRPYLGQQLIYTFRFYQSIKLYHKPQYEMPIFNGFDTIGLPVQEYNLLVAGRTYLITEIRIALFPEIDGQAVIGPSRLTIPGNFFEEPIELIANSMNIQVRALPGQAPLGFKGAVGQYQMKAWVSPEVAIVNQPVTLQVAVSGVGNIQALPEPTWPYLKEWRIYDSLHSQTTATTEGQLSGTRVYELLILSDQVGDIAVPQTKFIYFDPVAADYKTLTSKTLYVRIIPAPTPEPATATALAIAAQPTPTPNRPSASYSQPVNEVFSDSATAYSLALSMVTILFFGMCSAIPVAAVIGAGAVWLWQKRQKQVEIETTALKNPAKKMHSALAVAVTKNDDNYKAVSQALYDYLSEALQVSVRGLTQTELISRLQGQGIPKSLTNKIQDHLTRSEIARFSPGSDNDGWELLARTDELLFALDEIFNSE